MFNSPFAKKMRAVLVALVVTFATNYAISYAARPVDSGTMRSGNGNKATVPPPARSGNGNKATVPPPSISAGSMVKGSAASASFN